MLTSKQIKDFSQSLKINESVVFREYIQTLFLKELYEEKYSSNIFFKGGTAIRLLWEGTRFSEDLDFTVSGGQKSFLKFTSGFFKKLEKLYNFSFKKRKSVAGIKYLLTVNSKALGHKVFIGLDFSFREKVLKPNKSTIATNYPIIFTSFVNHLSAEEVVAEKIRALLTRNKGRDIYDLWFLLSKNIKIQPELVEKKLAYYDLKKFSPSLLVKKIKGFSQKKFVLDLRPFVPINQRNKLADFFEYTVVFLEKKIIK
ncbi:MAG: nucleotidyl transferase AbiEii/AbiGii toxin family protein [Candidatus Shapirobacteria bacterium]